MAGGGQGDRDNQIVQVFIFLLASCIEGLSDKLTYSSHYAYKSDHIVKQLSNNTGKLTPPTCVHVILQIRKKAPYIGNYNQMNVDKN